jgi:methylenetetrahydrofolate reductase (NADPH)
LIPGLKAGILCRGADVRDPLSSSISRRVRAPAPTLSYEFFPPRDDDARAQIREVVSTIAPDFATVTYGAGGSTRDHTFETALELNALLPCAHHLTILRHTTTELETIVERIRGAGLRNIIAIRGDAPRDAEAFPRTPGGLGHADELVALIKRVAPSVDVIVAGYPEGHTEALSARHEMEVLRRKQDYGADVVFTQLFYENDVFYRWRDACLRAGISLPIVPGLMAVSSPRQLRKISRLCGATLPDRLMAELDRWESDAEERARVGADWCVRQAEDLLRNGVPGIHIYCLNRSHPAIEVGRRVGLALGREAPRGA